MSVEENLRMAKEALDVVNSRDWERFDKLHAESIVEYSPRNPEPTKGIDAHRESIQGFINAFPDMQFKEEWTFGQGDWVCSIWTGTGTHTEPLEVPGGETIPATNKPVTFTLCGVSKIEEGKVTEEHNFFDRLGLRAQLGLAP